jgi:hypothetical protein
LHEFFPLGLVEGIGVMDEERLDQVKAVTGDCLPVKIKRRWYY